MIAAVSVAINADPDEGHGQLSVGTQYRIQVRDLHELARLLEAVSEIMARFMRYEPRI